MGRKIDIELTDNMIEDIVAKINDNISLTWEELMEKYNIDFMSKDHFRKMATGIDLLYNHMNDNDSKLMNMEAYEKLLKREIKVKKEVQKLTDLRTLVNRELREYSREKNLLDIANDYVEHLDNIDKLTLNNTNVVKDTKRAGVLLVSDVHYGLDVKCTTNVYNSEICKERLSTLLSETIEHSKTNNVSELNLFLLGDLINGLIHTTTRIENREQVVIQSLEIAELMSKFIFKLSETQIYSKINVYFVSGNHDRVLAKKQDNTLDDDFGLVIKTIMKDRLRDISNVNMIENEFRRDIICCNILNSKVFATHGDKDKIESSYKNLVRLTGEVPDYIFLGHYHHLVEDSIGRTEIIANGGFGGDTEYTGDLRLTSRPAQRFMVFNEKGRLCTYNITLD